MEPPWTLFPVTEKVRGKLVHRVRVSEPVFTFAGNRHLAALLTSLSLQAEMGGELDRLGQTLGGKGPWQSEIIEYENDIGIRLWREGTEEFQPQNIKLADFLHPLSISASGKFNQLVFFPAQIADKFRREGIELVIIRDWILNSGLEADRLKAVAYTKSNLWEMSNNIAHAQAKVLSQFQLPFFGTHDINDHLMGATRSGLELGNAKIKRVLTRFDEVFEGGMAPSLYSLIISYLIGLVLDDLAQPRWYQSSTHPILLDKLLSLFEFPYWQENDVPHLFIPKSFNEVVRVMRSEPIEFNEQLDPALNELDEELKAHASSTAVA